MTMRNSESAQAAEAIQEALDKRSATATTTEATPLLPNGTGDGAPEINGNGSPKWSGDSDFAGLTWWHKPSIWWLLPGFFIFSLAFGGIAVPRINLLLTLVCRAYLAEQSIAEPGFTFAPVILGGDNQQCRIPEVQALATKFALYNTIIAGVLAAIVSPKLGELSDRHGRRRLLSITIVGGIVGELIYILAASYPDTVNYQWVLLASFLDGICGSFIGGMAITHSYAADCTTPAKRAVAFGYFHASLFAGIAIGPVIAGLVVKATGNIILIFWGAFFGHTIFLLYVTFVIPESLSMKKQLMSQERHRHEVAMLGFTPSWLSTLNIYNILAPLKILWPTGEGSSRQVRMNLVLLSAVSTIIFSVAMAGITVVIYYSQYMFNWHDFETQIFVGVANTVRVITLLALLPFLNYIFRTRYRNRVRRESGIELVEKNSGSDNLDLYTIRIALLFEVIGYVGYAAARSGPLFFAGGVVASLGGMGSPILQSALTKHVPHDRVGQLLGAIGLLHALARVVAPTIFSLMYAATVKTFPQTVFVVLAALFGIGFVVSWFIKPHVYLEELDSVPHSDPAEDEFEDAYADEDVVAV